MKTKPKKSQHETDCEKIVRGTIRATDRDHYSKMLSALVKKPDQT